MRNRKQSQAEREGRKAMLGLIKVMLESMLSIGADIEPEKVVDAKLQLEAVNALLAVYTAEDHLEGVMERLTTSKGKPMDFDKYEFIQDFLRNTGTK